MEVEGERIFVSVPVGGGQIYQGRTVGGNGRLGPVVGKVVGEERWWDGENARRGGEAGLPKVAIQRV